MGVIGLLPVLRPAMKQVNLTELKGQRVGVDANVWIHRGTYPCACELVLGKPTDLYARYCRKLCLRLRECGVYPVLVFDGRAVPAKAHTARKRRELRAVAKRALDETIDAVRELEAQYVSAPLVVIQSPQRATLDFASTPACCHLQVDEQSRRQSSPVRADRGAGGIREGCSEGCRGDGRDGHDNDPHDARS